MPSSGVQTCARSEEHTSELQSHSHLVCRLLLEKKKPLLTNEEKSVMNTTHPATRDTCSLTAVLHLLSPRLHFCVCLCRGDRVLLFFFLNDRAPPKIYPFPLPGALPI